MSFQPHKINWDRSLRTGFLDQHANFLSGSTQTKRQQQCPDQRRGSLRAISSSTGAWSSPSVGHWRAAGNTPLPMTPGQGEKGKKGEKEPVPSRQDTSPPSRTPSRRFPAARRGPAPAAPYPPPSSRFPVPLLAPRSLGNVVPTRRCATRRLGRLDYKHRDAPRDLRERERSRCAVPCWACWVL